jgi:hypothetical protein
MIPLKKAIRPSKEEEKVHGVIEYIEKQFQKYFAPSKNIAIDESTVGFKGKIIFKTCNPKDLQSGVTDYLY